jgi:DNA-directed RNA polymerase specialized sigma24 family protein
MRRRDMNPFVLSDQERKALRDLALTHRRGSVEARRAHIILLSADGLSCGDICRMVGCTSATVTAWRRRFLKSRVAGLRRASSAQPRTRLAWLSAGT